jgi:hypothetical protein
VILSDLEAEIAEIQLPAFVGGKNQEGQSPNFDR